MQIKRRWSVIYNTILKGIGVFGKGYTEIFDEAFREAARELSTEMGYKKKKSGATTDDT